MAKLTQDIFTEQINFAYQRFSIDKTFAYPEWLYWVAKGALFKVEVEDCPDFGETAYLEFDAARTAFLSIDMQTDFCGPHGYVDVMGYDLQLITTAIQPIKRILDFLRNENTNITVIHTREGHLADLSDLPFNKILRSKLIGKGIGIGDKPPNGLGRLLIRDEPNWDIIPELYPVKGEYVIDKAGKGYLEVSNLFLLLKNLNITHLILSGITTDVCVQTIMREANDLGFWCLLVKDATAATNYDNYLAAIKQIKMQGGVFGWVSDSSRLLKALNQIFVADGQDASLRPTEV